MIISQYWHTRVQGTVIIHEKIGLKWAMCLWLTATSWFLARHFAIPTPEVHKIHTFSQGLCVQSVVSLEAFNECWMLVTCEDRYTYFHCDCVWCEVWRERETDWSCKSNTCTLIWSDNKCVWGSLYNLTSIHHLIISVAMLSCCLQNVHWHG